MFSKENNSVEVGWRSLFHWWLTINYVFFAFITQPILYIQTAEAVRLNRFGPPRHGDPDFDSPDYRRARSFFRANRANDSDTMALEPPSQNNDDIILIGGPPRHQVLDQQAFFANARPQQPPHRPQQQPNQVQNQDALDPSEDVKTSSQDQHCLLSEDADSNGALPTQPKKKAKASITQSLVNRWTKRWSFLEFDLEKQKMKCTVFTKLFILVSSDRNF